MKSLIIFCVLSMFALTSNAQNKLDNTVNKAGNSINSAGATATNAVNTVSSTSVQAKALANQLHGLLGKKKMASDDVVTTTEISIQGCNYTILKKLNESIRSCSGVQDSKSKFSADGSSITVTHTGATDQLFAMIEKKAPDLVKDSNLVNIEDGKIVLKLQ